VVEFFQKIPLTTGVLMLGSEKHPLGDATTVVSIFTDSDFTDSSLGSGPWAPESLLTMLELLPNEPLPVLHTAFIPENISECYFDSFLFQSIFFVKLHLDDAARPDTSQPPVRPTPVLPHFDPRSSPSYSYFGNSAPVEPGTPIIAAPSGVPLSLPCPSPASPLSHLRP
jgi:hypothetical protein